ncbi:MAG TPA: PA14 domain-containing protein [Nitrosomonas sp.]|nr:PA14 domain-containing protein [Nitrosomonas sp.]HMY61328.1 PA14 domain-containing protein [Nitrosomonas sp.]HNJ91255.1 PA14 domain-containing protein [Nitrosomonas sp.]
MGVAKKILPRSNVKGGVMFQRKIMLVTILFTFLLVDVTAAPVPVGPALMGSGDGLKMRWVNTDFSPHSITDAAQALNLRPGDVGYVGEVSGVTKVIDFEDGNYGDLFRDTDQAVPLGADDNFAVLYKGFLNVTVSGNYTFRSFTDDGFRLTIGGEVVSLFNSDRSPGETTTSVFLNEGLYHFEFIGWEQGGQFVNELAWIKPGEVEFTQPGDRTNLVFFTTQGDASVPEPMMLSLFLIGLIVMGYARQSRQS